MTSPSYRLALSPIDRLQGPAAAAGLAAAACRPSARTPQIRTTGQPRIGRVER